MPEILAALASIPARAPFLRSVLESLRPHVDRIHVFLNGYDDVPDVVLDLADEHVVSADNGGAERKFWWSDRWTGYYLSCDDDIVYPADYVPAICEAIADHEGQALVTCHGRTYLGTPRAIHEVEPASIGKFHKRVDYGRFVNCGGTGVMGWDAGTVRVPSQWRDRNMADLQTAVWAQQNAVPIWLIPHRAHWFRPLQLMDPQGIYRTSQRERHVRRNALLVEQGHRAPWRLFQLPALSSDR